MPIFQRPDAWPPKPPQNAQPDRLTPKDDSKLQFLPDGSLRSQSPEDSQFPKSAKDEIVDKEQNSTERALCTDRAELIERIKRGESPTWVPSRALQQEYLRANGEPLRPTPPREQNPPSLLLPPADINSYQKDQATREELHSPYEIERPRSALHAGDFTEDKEHSTNPSRKPVHGSGAESQTHTTDLSGSPPTLLWYRPLPSLTPFDSKALWTEDGQPTLISRLSRDRAPSLSSFSSSSYVLKAPTTPLVQQANNTDLDFSSRDRSASPDKGTRRHTLPPHALRDWNSRSNGIASPASPLTTLSHSYRREASFPHAQQARRPLNSNWSLQHPPSPPTPGFLRSRRTSLSSEASPRQRASMVGSYEESILRGRMSTAPSKPFDFTAHIGALGKGKKPKMPAHVTVPFQAVFYDWSSKNSRDAANDEPSPYVGHIDLQNIDLSATSQTAGPGIHKVRTNTLCNQTHDGTIHDRYADLPLERPNKRKRPRDHVQPPHGNYRIPEQGQIQVVIKNPYKTALKLFLVPYDLTGMEPGQKTFVRQRYYSMGPIIERPIASAAADKSRHSRHCEKPTLRYLIHLNICCPSKGHFFLYQHIRVVFANRVPDDKEHLSKDVQEPKPKYTPWKPNMDTLPNSPAGVMHKADKAARRRSLGHSYSDLSTDSRRMHSYAGGSYPYTDANAPPVPPIPFQLSSPQQLLIHSSLGHDPDTMDMDISRPATSSDLNSPLSDKMVCNSGHFSSDNGESDSYIKLRKGDAGYGGVFGRPGTPEPGEGLLARRLRGLGVQGDIDMKGRDGWDIV